MSDIEKQQYSDNVIADLESVLKALDSDVEELKAARIREKIYVEDVADVAYK